MGNVNIYFSVNFFNFAILTKSLGKSHNNSTIEFNIKLIK
jgi:hypothetical protein